VVKKVTLALVLACALAALPVKTSTSLGMTTRASEAMDDQADGISNIKEFLEICPAEDAIYPQIRADFKIRRNGVLVGDVPCSSPTSQMPISQYTDEVIVLQGLRTVYYMDLGRSGHLPWTPGTLYEWMKTKIGGVNISDTSAFDYCCDTYDGQYYFVTKAQDDANRESDRFWPSISGNIGLYMHETRHLDDFPHVSECGIPIGCDQTYDETNLSPYGIQWWLNAEWLTGELYVGFSCLSADEMAEIAAWHSSSLDLFRVRFVDVKPPILTAPAFPGDPDDDGPCNSVDPDDDNDSWQDATETACGSNRLNAASLPERTDTPGDEDADGLLDEALPAGAEVYDCDGDGYRGSTEQHVYGLGGTVGDQDPCGTNTIPPTAPATPIGWPSDLRGDSINVNKVNILDLGTFVAPVRRLNTSPGDVSIPGDPDEYHVRWDLVPGTTVGETINIVDVAALITGTTGYPPMLGGQKALGGPPCPWPP